MRVIDLAYLYVVVKCESLLQGHGKTIFTVKERTFNLTVLGRVMLLASVA